MNEYRQCYSDTGHLTWSLFYRNTHTVLQCTVHSYTCFTTNNKHIGALHNKIIEEISLKLYSKTLINNSRPWMQMQLAKSRNVQLNVVFDNFSDH